MLCSCWKQRTFGWVRSTLVLPLLCPGRSGLQDWSQKPLSWFLTDRAPSLPGALTCLPMACWTHSAMAFFLQFSTGQLLRLPVPLASVLLATARQTLYCSSPLQCAFKKKKKPNKNFSLQLLFFKLRKRTIPQPPDTYWQHGSVQASTNSVTTLPCHLGISLQ